MAELFMKSFLFIFCRDKRTDFGTCGTHGVPNIFDIDCECTVLNGFQKTFREKTV